MNKEESPSNRKLSMGILIGVVLGSVYGSMTDDIAQCVGLGASFGLFIGAFWVKMSNGEIDLEMDNKSRSQDSDTPS